MESSKKKIILFYCGWDLKFLLGILYWNISWMRNRQSSQIKSKFSKNDYWDLNLQHQVSSINQILNWKHGFMGILFLSNNGYHYGYCKTSLAIFQSCSCFIAHHQLIFLRRYNLFLVRNSKKLFTLQTYLPCPRLGFTWAGVNSWAMQIL